jgi:hypothetical protein
VALESMIACLSERGLEPESAVVVTRNVASNVRRSRSLQSGRNGRRLFFFEARFRRQLNFNRSMGSFSTLRWPGSRGVGIAQPFLRRKTRHQWIFVA